MRLERALERLHRFIVQAAAKIRGILGRPAELLGQPRKQLGAAKLAVTFLQHDLAKRIVAERHQDGGQIAEELVKRRGLRADRFVKMRAQAVEYGMAEFVIDDI